MNTPPFPVGARFGHIVAAQLFVLLSLVSRTHAQVNAEALAAAARDSGWTLDTRVSLSLLKGNIDVVDLGGGMQLRYSDRSPSMHDAPFHNRLLVLADARRNTVQSRRIVNTAFFHARYTRMLRERFGIDAFAQWQHDDARRLVQRRIVGAGIRVDIVRAQGFQVWTGGGYMLEWNELAAPPGGLREHTWEHRWTQYFSVRHSHPTTTAVLEATAYVQPRFDRPDDARILVEAVAEMPLFTALVVGARFGLTHDTAPPDGVKATDYRLAHTLRVRIAL